MWRRIIWRCKFLLFFIFTFPVYASCKVILEEEVPFGYLETALNNKSITILNSYTLRVNAIDIDVIIVYPTRLDCKMSNYCDIDAKRVENVKAYLVENGIPENKVFAFNEQKTVDFLINKDAVLVESIGFDRRCLMKEHE
jgi:hypothetical protein